MKRKEVIVGHQVFDLGIKELEEGVANRDGRCRTMELEVGPTVFQVGILRQEQAIVLNWWGLTDIMNVVWTRWLILRLKRPFLKKVECFTYATGEV